MPKEESISPSEKRKNQEITNVKFNMEPTQTYLTKLGPKVSRNK
jgi:hypothetical protein